MYIIYILRNVINLKADINGFQVLSFFQVSTPPQAHTPRGASPQPSSTISNIEKTSICVHKNLWKELHNRFSYSVMLHIDTV
jgi:hypothetical protein